MQALEMEEVESLIGPSRKKLNSTRNKPANSENMFTSLATDRSFTTKLIGVACIVMIGILYVTASDGKESAKNVEVSTLETLNNASQGSESSPTDNNRSLAGNMDGKYMYSKYATIVPLIDHPLPDDKKKQDLAEKWGHWHFWDGDEDMRPTDDYCSKWPNRDIPGDEFPDDAWQGDAVFVNHYLNDADQLLSRAMEAIFTEYGHGKPLPPEEMAARMKMFHWEKIDLSTQTTPPQKYSRRGDRGNGGWTTKRSFQGLVRRLLHAMMTSDTFTVVMGGHSAAAGQGNHFRQSYMMQFHKIMEPIFARLGVKLITRNVGQGGLGTVQGAMGSAAVYGDEIDLLLWDSGMTEGGNTDHIDLFLRQGLIAGNRVPVVWGGNFNLLRNLHENADADVGELGLATDGIIEVENEQQSKSVPWAARFMKCKEEAKPLCDAEPRFCAHCWLDRDDGIKPTVGQRPSPRGQVKWHPGWRKHQLTGRNLAFSVLEALQAAVNIWSEGVMGGPPLDDDLWHVTEYYDNIRSKVKDLDASIGDCNKISEKLPARMCNTPMKGRTQYTPRANYHENSLTSIIKPTSDGYVPKNEKTLLYDGADVHNPCLDIPDGEVDVFDIVSGRRRLENNPFAPKNKKVDALPTADKAESANSSRNLEGDITPGKGWEVWAEPAGICDGTYNAVCNIQADNECALYGHHDERGAIVGNEFSGWLVMNLDDLKEGIIVIKLHTWHVDAESTKTKGWATVNNERALRGLSEEQKMFYEDMQRETDPANQFVEVDETGERMLMRSYDTPELPDTFAFEYAIDGKITTLSKAEFLEKKQQIQRVVETVTLLDDPNFTSAPKNVELAIRLKGCGRSCTFGVSHLYWA